MRVVLLQAVMAKNLASFVLTDSFTSTLWPWLDVNSLGSSKKKCLKMPLEKKIRNNELAKCWGQWSELTRMKEHFKGIFLGLHKAKFATNPKKLRFQLAWFLLDFKLSGGRNSHSMPRWKFIIWCNLLGGGVNECVINSSSAVPVGISICFTQNYPWYYAMSKLHTTFITLVMAPELISSWVASKVNKDEN